jgi:predicted GH43/DUF377 family glycosyl hydrolase
MFVTKLNSRKAVMSIPTLKGLIIHMKDKRAIIFISLLLILLTVCSYFVVKMPAKKHIIIDDTHFCVNALHPLKIKDYTGFNQPMHPKVLYFDTAWNGWKYWMSYTPYPNSNAVFENPSIAVSNDGINWISPHGMQNPVIKQPRDTKRGGHFSDPHLVFVDNTLQLWYRYNPAKAKKYGPNYHVNQIFMIFTKDGSNWSAPKLIFDDKYAYLSPAILFDNGVYKVWFSDNDGKLHYKQSSNLVSWSLTQIVNLRLENNHIWHQDVIKNNGQYEIIFSAFEKSKDIQSLYFATSSDEINFTKPEQILKPSSGNVTALDNQMIYRSSLVDVNGKYKVYYSAMDTKHDWHIFLTNFNIKSTY